jgi:hypothetical protein
MESALLVGSGFVGIGGMSLLGSGASDQAICTLWEVTGILTGTTFMIALPLLAYRAASNKS